MKMVAALALYFTCLSLAVAAEPACPAAAKWKGKSCKASVLLAKKCNLLERANGGEPEAAKTSAQLFETCEKATDVKASIKEEANAAGKNCYPKEGEDGFGGSLGGMMAMSCKLEKYLELIK